MTNGDSQNPSGLQAAESAQINVDMVNLVVGESQNITQIAGLDELDYFYVNRDNTILCGVTSNNDLFRVFAVAFETQGTVTKEHPKTRHINPRVTPDTHDDNIYVLLQEG